MTQIGTCKECKFFTAPDGSEGRWMVCSNPKIIVQDAYNNPQSIVNTDGIGYSDSAYSKSDAELYVGEDFGCIHFEKKG